jgi:sulfopyruvate decarboxylase subunit alpha
MTISEKLINDPIGANVKFVTTVPCKQLADVIEKIGHCTQIQHVPSNKEDEGMGLCAGAGAYLGGKRS